MLARASDELAVANGALALVDESRLSSLDENRPVARAIENDFGTTRDALLRRANWNFALRYASPARDPAALPGSFANGFPLPADCLRVRSVDGLDSGGWSIEVPTTSPAAQKIQTYLYADASIVRICYTASVTHVALWDPLFAEVFQLELAAKIAPVLGQGGAVQGLLDAAARKLATARRVDEREAARATVSRDVRFVSVRR